MNCPGCSTPLTFIEVCYDNLEESKLAYSCNTDVVGCSITIIYIITNTKKEVNKQCNVKRK